MQVPSLAFPTPSPVITMDLYLYQPLLYPSLKMKLTHPLLHPRLPFSLTPSNTPGLPPITALILLFVCACLPVRLLQDREHIGFISLSSALPRARHKIGS